MANPSQRWGQVDQPSSVVLTSHQFGWLVFVWILLIPWQYGYHISVLNQIQAVVTCKDLSPDTRHYGLPTCLPMSDFKFSVVTAVFTVGGLAGSLVSNLVMDRWGRRGAARASSLLVAVGAGLMCVSASVGILGLGRYVYIECVARV